MADRWHIALIRPEAMNLKRRPDGTWEANVACLLRERGYSVYYPGLPKHVSKGNGVHCIAMRAMFPGYLFVNESPQGWEWLRTTPGVRTINSLLMINGHFAILPDGEIDRIANIAGALIDQILNPPPRQLPYGVGDTVLVNDGPFGGRYAKIEALDDDERIALLLDIFGRPTRVFASHTHLLAT